MRKIFAVVALSALCALAAGCGSGGDAEPYEEPTPYGDDDTEDVTGTDDVIAVSMELADSWMGFHEPERLAWSWDAAVLMMGLWNLDGVVHDGRYRAYVKAWLDHHIDVGYVVATSDTAVPGYIAMLAYQEWGDAKYREVGDVVWDYIENKAARTDDGGLNHLGWTSGRQLWIDSLFMFGPFLMRYAQVIGDDAPAREYAHQLEVFRDHLRDEETGLYRHRYDGDTGTVDPAERLFWGRGNGWVFVAENIALTELPQAVRDGMDFDLAEDLTTMFASLRAYTTPSGRFHTLVNAESTYAETSAGLLFAYGAELGAQSGLLDGDEAIDSAEHWITGTMAELTRDSAGDMLLLGTSYGTSPGDLDYYNQVLKGENVSYGIGAFLLAAVERETVGHKGVIVKPGFRVPDETYVDHPIPCRQTACGQFYMARGHFQNAQAKFDETFAENPSEAAANFYDALIDLIHVGEGVVAQLDRRYVGLTDTAGVIGWLAAQAPLLRAVADRMEIAESDPAFSSISERILLIESGGHSAVGHVEFDTGEAFLLDGAAHVLAGALTLLDGAKDDVPRDFQDAVAWVERRAAAFAARGQRSMSDDAIDEMIGGIDKIIDAINEIMAETDDQSDDFIPKNLLQLTGSWGIPGLLPEQPVEDLLGDLPIPPGSMPGALIELLRVVQSILRVVKLFV